MLNRLKCLIGLHNRAHVIGWKRIDGRNHIIQQCEQCGKQFWA